MKYEWAIKWHFSGKNQLSSALMERRKWGRSSGAVEVALSTAREKQTKDSFRALRERWCGSEGEAMQRDVAEERFEKEEEEWVLSESISCWVGSHSREISRQKLLMRYSNV
jgi:hypothetical protein